MGTDIHLRVQQRGSAGTWRFLDSRTNEWYSGRNYNLFAILADVRNGRGFAGVVTGDGFNPISEPRGLPEDLDYDEAAIYDSEDEDAYDTWLGEHDQSWLSFSEILNYDWGQETYQQGVIPAKDFKSFVWRRKTFPAEFLGPHDVSGGVFGRGISVVDEDSLGPTREKDPVALGYSHVSVRWRVVYAQSAGSFYNITIPRLLRYMKAHDIEPDDIRFVFGFDS